MREVDEKQEISLLWPYTDVVLPLPVFFFPSKS